MNYRNSKLRNNRGLIMTGAITLLSFSMLCFGQITFAWLAQSGAAPSIKAESATYNESSGKLVIKGSNFSKGAAVALLNSSGQIGHGKIKIRGSKKILISDVAPASLAGGVDVIVTNPDGTTSGLVHLRITLAADESKLTANDVKRIIAQAVAQAEASGLKATIAVVDKEGNNLGTFTMNGAPAQTRVGIGTKCAPSGCATLPPRCGLEGVCVPACTAAISKAITGSFLSTLGHAFTTRTASFIVQEHFPPGVDFQPSGPLFGVQFSQLLCSDINPRAPLGLSADPGGVPLYKNGKHVGGIGVEGDGKYTLDPDPLDDDMPVEELVAIAGTRGFEAPPEIAGTINVNGIRFPFVNTPMPAAVSVPAFDQLRGSINTCIGLAPAEPRNAPPSEFINVTLDGVEGRVNTRLFPDFRNNRRFRSSRDLSESEVRRILVQAAKQAFITRAAIRLPASSPAEVNISVVDVDGNLLGIFSTPDAPIFGFDVSVQKARTAAFFSKATAARDLRRAGFGRYVDAAARDGLNLDGAIAFSDRANGFLSRPFYPDGIDGTEHGPFSLPIEDFSPFNVGLQLDLILDEYFGNILRALGGDGAALTNALSPPCPSLDSLANGIQIFPGSVPLYKNGRLVGGIGISGDGVDQDDLIASQGSAGFESPPEIRTDRFFVRGIRLPFVKFPRHPNR